MPATAPPGRDGLFFITVVWEVNWSTTSARVDANTKTSQRKKKDLPVLPGQLLHGFKWEGCSMEGRKSRFLSFDPQHWGFLPMN